MIGLERVKRKETLKGENVKRIEKDYSGKSVS